MTIDELQTAAADYIAAKQEENRKLGIPDKRLPSDLRVFMEGEKGPVAVGGGILLQVPGPEIVLMLTPLKLDQVGGF